MAYLLLWLEGPLQSWGCNSHFDTRATLPFPTRSGVLGLLLCAQGKSGPQEEWLAQMAGYRQTARAYARARNAKWEIDKPENKRPETEPVLKDFQTVGSNYDGKDKWQSCLVPKTHDGSPSNVKGAKIILRHYLQDMAFACVLEMPQEIAVICQKALEAPVWPVFLGRKNCPPTDLISRGIFADELEALAAADAIAWEKGRLETFTVRDGADDDGEGDDTWTIQDVPLYFGTWKKCRDRQVTIYKKRYSE